jgi:formylglycine-generating enzyme required for sulfatase activity
MVSLARTVVSLVVAALGLAGSALAQLCASPPDVSTYCTAGTTVHGCVPSIAGVGVPSAVDSSGFDIVVSNVPGQRAGTIFFGFYPASIPWAPFSPSYQCVAFPIQRTGDRFSGGVAGQCNGELRLDFNAWRAAHPTALGSPYVAGQVFNAQGWFRDPGSPKQTNLSNALRFVLAPLQWPTPPGMVPIPAGTFMMGSNAASGSPYFGELGNSAPAHQVTITYCYWMGETEVTQAQYSALMGTNPSFFVGPNNPVEQVTWFDAQAYCAALSAQAAALGSVPPGYQYRLPTEAEWEYACRAGTATEFSVGTSILCSQARFKFSLHTNSFCGSTSTTPVRSYAPNAWGLFDMHGNVWEWCLDSFAAYSSESVADPFVTGGAYRTYRGGTWFADSFYCRAAFRGINNVYPTYTGIDHGFRVVLAPILTP